MTKKEQSDQTVKPRKKRWLVKISLMILCLPIAIALLALETTSNRKAEQAKEENAITLICDIAYKNAVEKNMGAGYVCDREMVRWDLRKHEGTGIDPRTLERREITIVEATQALMVKVMDEYGFITYRNPKQAGTAHPTGTSKDVGDAKNAP